MKTPTQFILLAAIAAVVSATGLAQDKKKGPTGKFYVAQATGDVQVVADGRVFVPKQGSAFNAPGSVIETGKGAKQAVVYSNGSAMFLDQNTRVEIGRFVQEPFRTDRGTTDTEPSISQTEIFLAQGSVGICAGGALSGTTVTYNTPQASINVRGRRLVIDASREQTTVSALEGDITIRTGAQDQSGQVIHAGEQAIIRSGLSGQPPSIHISALDQAALATAEASAMQACGARKTVSFETVDGAGEGSDIEAHPTVPATPPVNITVSPDRIEPTR
ncbi:MAG TPA: FecR domain-containing protein [Candidatus Didemnitutus sp.]|nr:FecR domain-containing protein [Candidatus Didemnitutus sp.]